MRNKRWVPCAKKYFVSVGQIFLFQHFNMMKIVSKNDKAECIDSDGISTGFSLSFQLLRGEMINQQVGAAS